MRFSATVLAGLVAAVSVAAQEDAGTTGSMTTLLIETTQSLIVESTISSNTNSLVATSTSVLVVDTTTSVAPAVSGTQAASPAEVSRAACLDECDPSDNDCRAECGKIANSVNPIADCQTGCFKGNGTDADNRAYQGCMEECIRTATTSAAAATSTSSASEATETDEVTATTDSEGAENTASSRVASPTSGAAAAASSAAPAAGNNVKATFSGAGILGAVAFMLAL